MQIGDCPTFFPSKLSKIPPTKIASLTCALVLMSAKNIKLILEDGSASTV